jgi:hypothetical protein
VHLLPAERSDHRVIDGERAAEVVTAERDGRVIRHQLADGPVAGLLAE